MQEGTYIGRDALMRRMDSLGRVSTAPAEVNLRRAALMRECIERVIGGQTVCKYISTGSKVLV